MDYKCYYCGKKFKTIVERNKHVEEHDIIYVPMARSDLNRLLNFLMTGSKGLLSENFMKRLFSYAKGNRSGERY